MGLQVQLTNSASCGTYPCDALAASYAIGFWYRGQFEPDSPTIHLTDSPERWNFSTQIVFIQVMRYLVDGVLPVSPHLLDWDKAYKSPDATALLYVVDYLRGASDPYYNGIGGPGNAHTNTPAWMIDAPGSPLAVQPAVRLNISRMRKAFRTAVFSAAGTDVGTYYVYQDWFCDYEIGSKTSLTLGFDGKDPGQDFKDAVELWCTNHSFALPAPPTPPYHPPLLGMKRYPISAGDTLQSLARRFYGDEVYATLIFKQNLGVVPSPFQRGGPFFGQIVLIPGQTLIIP